MKRFALARKMVVLFAIVAVFVLLLSLPPSSSEEYIVDTSNADPNFESSFPPEIAAAIATAPPNTIVAHDGATGETWIIYLSPTRARN